MPENPPVHSDEVVVVCRRLSFRPGLDQILLAIASSRKMRSLARKAERDVQPSAPPHGRVWTSELHYRDSGT